MIKQLNILNFQSHKDSELQFDEGVNIIVGKSDSGKSAILRALRWCIYNRPSGDSFRSNWKGKTSVELFTDDAHVVRSKDKENEYILGDTHFKAFSTEVPQEIANALNISDVNIQSQLDAPYLLSKSPGEVAQHFNKVANLDEIDISTQNINGWIREITSDIKYTEEQELDLQEQIKKFAHLEKFEIDVEVLEEMENRLKNLVSSKLKLQVTITSYQTTIKEIEDFQTLLQLEKPLNAILDLIDLRAEKDIETVKLDRLIVQIEKIQVEIDEQKDLISIEKPVLEMLKLYQERNMAVERQKGLFKILSNIRSVSDRIKSTMSDLTSLEVRFKKEMGNVCVLCGQSIKR